MTPVLLGPLNDSGEDTHAGPPPDTRHDHADSRVTWHDRDRPDSTDHEPADAITGPIPVASLQDDRLRTAPSDDVSHDVATTAFDAHRSADPPIGTWKPALNERPRFRVVQPWYRTKTAAAALSAVALTAVVIAGVLVSRGTEQTTSVTPQATTTASPPPSSAPPAPSRATPSPSSAPAPPPPPPPPPPAPATQANPPVRNNDSWSPRPPSPTKKPQLNVTRAPISATPPPPPSPGTNSATPGDGRSRGGCFGFC
jgi:hypothetical protein